MGFMREEELRLHAKAQRNRKDAREMLNRPLASLGMTMRDINGMTMGDISYEVHRVTSDVEF
jgi:hypothetical protein